MKADFKPKITIFYCINAFSETSIPSLNENDAYEVKTIQMACSSMVKDVFLLRAFEAGADAVIVIVCPKGQCRYVEGNLRAKKRIAWVQKILDEIGLDGRRLSIANLAIQDQEGAAKVLQKTLTGLTALGPNPAA